MLAFGPFTVDPVRRAVLKEGVALRLTLRCTELLIAFVRHPGKTLTKQQLLELAWPDPQASDATLAQHVFLLRRALRHERTEWIRTVPNLGYRFTGDVRAVESGDDERARALRSYVQSAERLCRIGSERALRSAIDLCTHAIALDESQAQAYALRANCWRSLAESMHAEPRACLNSAQADVDAALARDSSNATAQLEAAFCASMLHRESTRAQRHLDVVERAQPDHPELARARVHCALIGGRYEEALRHARVSGGALYAAVMYMMRDFTLARNFFDCFADRDPVARMQRGACRLLTGDMNGALQDFHAVYYAVRGEQTGGGPGVRQCALGLYIYALARSGNASGAQQHLKQLTALARKRYVSPMVQAMAYLGFRDFDNAVVCVEEALQRFDPWAAYVLVDPMLDELRKHPRFGDIARSAA